MNNAKCFSVGSAAAKQRRRLCCAQLILLSAQGVCNQGVAARLGITQQTVSKWTGRFLERGLDGGLDEPRPGASRTITDADVEWVIALTLKTTPESATHWGRGRWPLKRG